MLYAIIGEDFDFFVKEKTALKKKLHIEQEYEIIDSDHAVLVADEFGVEGFFEKPVCFITCKYLFDELVKNDVLPSIGLLASTKHVVCLYEKKSSKDLESFLEKHGVAPIHTAIKIEKKDPTPFLFTDYVIAKNKKDAWIEYRRLQKQQVETSQILAGLIWAIKSLALAITHTQAGDAGLNPYVFTKMAKNKKLWSETEVQQLLRTLLYISAEEQFDDEAESMRIEQVLFQL